MADKLVGEVYAHVLAGHVVKGDLIIIGLGKGSGLCAAGSEGANHKAKGKCESDDLFHCFFLLNILKALPSLLRPENTKK